MKSNGFILLPRDAQCMPVWKDSGAAHLWIHCMMKATFKPYGTLHPGQFATSKAQLASQLGWSKTTVIACLRKLQASGLLLAQSSDKGTVITILGWEQLSRGELPYNFYTPAAVSGGTENGLNLDQSLDTSQCNSDTAPVHELDTHYNAHTSRSLDTGTINAVPADTARTTTPTQNAESMQGEPASHESEVCVDMAMMRSFWLAYPSHRRPSMDTAVTLVRSAIQKGATMNALMAALRDSLNDPEWRKGIIKSMKNWLESEPWHAYTQSDTDITKEVFSWEVF